MAMFPHDIWKKSRLMECSAGAREVFMLVYGALDPWGVMVYSRRALVAAWCKDDDTQPPMDDRQLKAALEELEAKEMIDFYEVNRVIYIASRWHENAPMNDPKNSLPPWMRAAREEVGKAKTRRWKRHIDIDAWERWRADKSKPPQQQQQPRYGGEETKCADWELTEEDAARFLHERFHERYTDGWISDKPKSAAHMARAFLESMRKKGKSLSEATWEEELLRYEEEQRQLMRGR